MKKIFFIAIFFYFLVLFQNSFLACFSFFGIGLNVVLFSVILFNIFDKESSLPLPNFGLSLGVWSAFFGGLFLDIFSSNFIGRQILLFLLLSFFIKLFLKKYARMPGK